MAEAEDIPFILQGKYYEILAKENGSVTAKCRNCHGHHTIKGSLTATTNFLTHLKRSHSKLVEEYQDELKKDVKRRKLQPKKVKALPAQQNITDIFPVDKQKAISVEEKLLVNFVVKGIHSYSILEEEDFRKYAQGLNANAKLMSRQILVRRIDDRYNFMRSSILIKLDNVKYICITADGWTADGKGRSFIGMTAHWISNDLKRHSVALSCRRLKGTHSYDRLADLMLTILKEYKVSIEKVVKGITDNGSNFTKAFREFQVPDLDANDDLIDTPDIESCEFIALAEILRGDEDLMESEPTRILPPHHACASHGLNLICAVDIKKSKSSRLQQAVFAKCQGIWNKSGRSTKAAESIKELCGICIQSPICTRWNSTYDCLGQLIRMEEHLSQICTIVGLRGFTVAEIEFIKQYLQCVKPVAQGLDRLQGENNTFYGELIPTLLLIENKLKAQLESKPSQCPDLPKLLLDGLQTRFQPFLDLSTSQEDAIIATISHPYFKLRWAPKEKVLELQTQFVTKLCSENLLCFQSTDTATASIVQKTCETVSKDDEFFNFQDSGAHLPPNNKSAEQRIEDQCQAYFLSTSTDINMLNDFPVVKATFIKYNTPLPSSALHPWNDFSIMRKWFCLQNGND